ncbi:phosphatase [Clostridium swellfunianum]|uniref:phosphatase n=1 Tax=Clostridium swellfunianum TaxID=1367462 RepID=UPI00202F1D53|nr:phosphatase [Clostridium swellfunianum]MCM0651052.1 phosphatase [Clostridium swellfunianum]
MNYVIDTHTHTVASGHAYNTLLENIKYASDNGIEVLAATDHGPKMPGGPHIFYFSNLKVLPRQIYGVTLLKGCEANIIDFNGNLDIPDRLQKKMDIIIASLHDVCIEPGSREKNTNALIAAMKNPYVDIIGHCGNPAFPIYEEEVVKAAKEYKVLIEINNSSLPESGSRAGSLETCKKVARLCREYGVSITIGSDAHSCFQIGKFEHAHKLLMEVEMPEELIMNTKSGKILRYLKNKGKLEDLQLD